MMNRGASSESIPMDLIPDILSRLPAKSVARFRCVSKPWNSTICSQDFTTLFRTMSSSNPRLLIGVQQLRGVDCQQHVRTMFRFFSTPQPQNIYGKSSLVVAADFHTKFSEDEPCSFSYASGLFLFTKMVHEYDAVRVICNPSTGQYAILPHGEGTMYRRSRGGLLGFDPIGKQYKVLIFNNYNGIVVYHILTLGTEEMRWRMNIRHLMNGPRSHCSGICINGVLYFDIYVDRIGYFDVRSEEFKILYVDRDMFLRFEDWINYKGKLCGCNLKYGYNGGFPIKLRLWVLEDVEKKEWSRHTYALSAENKVFKVNNDLSVVGVTALGEIVLVKKKVKKPFYVFYFNPETNTLSSVEIQGVGEDEEYHEVFCFLDRVEDLSFDFMKTTCAATSNIHHQHRVDHQARTVAHLEQDRTGKGNKFDALYLLEDD